MAEKISPELKPERDEMENNGALNADEVEDAEADAEIEEE